MANMVTCPGCRVCLRVSPGSFGCQQCPRCRTRFTVPPVLPSPPAVAYPVARSLAPGPSRTNAGKSSPTPAWRPWVLCGVIVGSALLLTTGILWGVCRSLQADQEKVLAHHPEQDLGDDQPDKREAPLASREKAPPRRNTQRPKKANKSEKAPQRPKPVEQPKPMVGQQLVRGRDMARQTRPRGERPSDKAPRPLEPLRLPAKAPKPLVQDLVIRVPKAQQQKIDAAIARGVRFLKENLADDLGSVRRRGKDKHFGAIVLTGLTLLECGVPASDPALQQVADLVRSAAAHLDHTYSLSLAVLFLDRFGAPKDRPLIQKFAVRLIAGQNGRGGWTYHCPVLGVPEERSLLTALRSLPPLQRIVSTLKSVPTPERDKRSKSPTKKLRTADHRLQSTAQSKKLDRPANSSDEGAATDVRIGSAARFTSITRALPPVLKSLPILRFHSIPVLDNASDFVDDNSNTQFAILGLWAARKHGVPMDRALALVERRFRTSQNADGSWGYHHGGRSNADSMTCTGLLGLALALGLAHDLHGEQAMKGLQDRGVRRGLVFLGSGIGRKAPAVHPGRKKGHPHGRGFKGKGKGKKGGRMIGAAARGDLYYLWSVERVAMGYGLHTIAGKEWYPWGAELILTHQEPDGGWRDRHAGLPDTCFALLFLKRANLAKELPTRVLHTFDR